MPERLSRGVERASDGLLDFLVVAFAAWTVVYHVSLLLGVGALWAAAVWVVALAPSAWLAVRKDASPAEGPRPDEPRPGSRRWFKVALPVNVVTAGTGAVLFAFDLAPWWAVWAVWVVAAGTTVVAASVRPARERAEERLPAGRQARWPDSLVALAWAVGLAVLSLFLVRPDGDDALYLRLSTWVAAHGELPLRDVVFSDEVFPAIVYPPLSSFEALAGTLARVTGVSAPTLVYLGVTPLASALGVLAVWRLMRRWNVPAVWLALSVTMAFLLLGAQGHRTLGNFFISRAWQGKVVFLVVLVPLLFALLSEYSERPTWRRLVLVAAAGTAGVGLTSSAAFIVPVIAAGAAAATVPRSLRHAAGLTIAAAYPLAALAATALAGSRRAAVYAHVEAYAPELARFVLGEGVLALVAVVALFVGPVLLGRGFAGRASAVTVLLVVLLLAPPVVHLVFDATGIGRVLWRLLWAVPIAVLVGVLATGVLPWIRPRALRALPAAGLCAALAVWGTPLWSGTTVATEPSWKRPAGQIHDARRILAVARPGDTILAPASVSLTILVMSGTVTTVAPRPFYAYALRDTPGGHARGRLLLLAFAEAGLGGRVPRFPGETVGAPDVGRALRTVGVDVACVPAGRTSAQRVLGAHDYSRAFSTRRLACFRASAPR